MSDIRMEYLKIDLDAMERQVERYVDTTPKDKDFVNYNRYVFILEDVRKALQDVKNLLEG